MAESFGPHVKLSTVVLLAVGVLVGVSLILGGRPPVTDPLSEPRDRATPARSVPIQRMEAAGIDVRVAAGGTGPSRLFDRHGTPFATGSIVPGTDVALAEAWRRNGCQVNPGNPSCLTIGLAAECLQNAPMPGCAVDRDGDRCTDVSEVLAGLDPFAGADCISNWDGAPAINCLFQTGNLACDERPSTGRGQTPLSGCAIDAAVQRALQPGNPYECPEGTATPEIECAFRERDPGCDGFLPAGAEVPAADG